MFKLRVLQAEYGDCLILEYGTDDAPRFLLVDGGPEGTYAEHLGAELRRIAASGGALDLVVLSHVDNDHTIGLLDLLAELDEQRANGAPPTIAASALWHNSFSQTIGSGTDVEVRLRAMVAAAGAAADVMAATGAAVTGIPEGNSLRRTALRLGFDLNEGFPDELICVDDAPAPVTLENLTLHVVGPTRANLDELKREWLEWLDDHEDAVASGDPRVAANADRSVPNLSSIMLLAEADQKRLLLTGDGRSDHLLTGLGQAGFLGDDAELHVDVLKVAHHGSNRNATKRFFRTVTADTYVLSANGRDDNPDLATLIWIVEAAHAQGRAIELVLTNETPSLAKLREEYDPAEFGYRTTLLSPGDDSIVVELAS
jgi:Metallo-beta-lactamase superfamily